MLYCLDTNIIIDILRGDEALRSSVENAINKRNTLCINPIVLSELFKGAYLAEKSHEAVELVEDFMNGVELLDFNEQACRIFGQRYTELKRRGKQTQEADLMIGAISLAHNAVLVTRNEKDFINIFGLKIETWQN